MLVVEKLGEVVAKLFCRATKLSELEEKVKEL